MFGNPQISYRKFGVGSNSNCVGKLSSDKFEFDVQYDSQKVVNA